MLQNFKKLFHLHYSSLYNVIEYIFKINKKQFFYLKIAIEFSKETQINIIYTVIILHNFICCYYFNNKKIIYNKNDLNNKKLKDVNEN